MDADVSPSANHARFRCRFVGGVAAIGSIALLPGCGGSANRDVTSIGRLVRSYDAALARGDFKTACDDSSEHVRAFAVSAAHAAKLIPANVTDCPTALAKVTAASTRQVGTTVGAVFAAIKIGAIVVHGNRATIAVTVAFPGRPIQRRSSEAVKESGAWKIDLNPDG